MCYHFTDDNLSKINQKNHPYNTFVASISRYMLKNIVTFTFVAQPYCLLCIDRGRKLSNYLSMNHFRSEAAQAEKQMRRRREPETSLK